MMTDKTVRTKQPEDAEGKGSDTTSEDEEPRPLITNRGFLPSTITLLIFGSAAHFTRWLSEYFPNLAPMLAILLMAFMFEWQRRRGRFTYGRLETRPHVDLVQLYQKQPYVRQDGTVIMATPVEAALVKAAVTAAVFQRCNLDDPESSEDMCM